MLYLLIGTAACTTTASNADSTKTAGTDSSANARASNDDQAKADIDKIRAGWRDAADRKDSAAIAAYYSDDAVMAVSEAPVASGKAAIEATLGRMVNMTKVNSIDSKELVVHGDNAYDYGTYSQTATMPNGKKADQNGYYIVTLHKGSDGAWKITHHLGVQPPAAAH
jgi:uncharacterized protein (TIGR02246 family)